jgi:hypothetical protein
MFLILFQATIPDSEEESPRIKENSKPPPKLEKRKDDPPVSNTSI